MMLEWLHCEQISIISTFFLVDCNISNFLFCLTKVNQKAEQKAYESGYDNVEFKK